MTWPERSREMVALESILRKEDKEKSLPQLSLYGFRDFSESKRLVDETLRRWESNRELTGGKIEYHPAWASEVLDYLKLHPSVCGIFESLGVCLVAVKR